MKALLAVDDKEGEGEGDGEEDGEEEDADQGDKPNTSRTGGGESSDESDSDESDDSDESGSSSEEGKGEGGKKDKPAELSEEKKLLNEILEKEKVLELEWHEIRDSAEQCWLSKDLKLFKGEYTILCDISYDLSNKKLWDLARPHDVNTEAPWMEGKELEVDRVWLQVSSVGRYVIVRELICSCLED